MIFVSTISVLGIRKKCGGKNEALSFSRNWQPGWEEKKQSPLKRLITKVWKSGTDSKYTRVKQGNDYRRLEKVFHFFFPFIFISWRLITLQYCSGFCHTLTWISHRFTSVPHPDPPAHLPLHPIPLGLPSVPAPSTCLMHPTWAGDLFHPR